MLPSTGLVVGLRDATERDGKRPTAMSGRSAPETLCGLSQGRLYTHEYLDPTTRGTTPWRRTC